MVSRMSAGNGGDVSDALRDAASKLGSDMSRTARDAREAAEELSDALRNSAEEAAETAKRGAIGVRRDIRKELREHPAAWLSAAAGIGILIGALVAGQAHKQ